MFVGWLMVGIVGWFVCVMFGFVWLVGAAVFLFLFIGRLRWVSWFGLGVGVGLVLDCVWDGCVVVVFFFVFVCLVLVCSEMLWVLLVGGLIVVCLDCGLLIVFYCFCIFVHYYGLLVGCCFGWLVGWLDGLCLVVVFCVIVVKVLCVGFGWGLYCCFVMSLLGCCLSDFILCLLLLLLVCFGWGVCLFVWCV